MVRSGRGDCVRVVGHPSVTFWQSLNSTPNSEFGKVQGRMRRDPEESGLPRLDTIEPYGEKRSPRLQKDRSAQPALSPSIGPPIEQCPRKIEPDHDSTDLGGEQSAIRDVNDGKY